MFIIIYNRYCSFNYNGFSSFIDKIKNILELDNYSDKFNEFVSKNKKIKKIKNKDNTF